MSQKRQSEKSSGLLQDWWSICLSYFFSCFNSIEGHKRLLRLFSGNLSAMFVRKNRRLNNFVLLKHFDSHF